MIISLVVLAVVLLAGLVMTEWGHPSYGLDSFDAEPPIPYDRRASGGDQS